MVDIIEQIKLPLETPMSSIRAHGLEPSPHFPIQLPAKTHPKG